VDLGLDARARVQDARPWYRRLEEAPYIDTWASIPQSVVDDAIDQWAYTAACMWEGQRSSLWTFDITDRFLSEPPTFSRRKHVFGVLKRHNFRVHVSAGSAQTSVRRGEIINHHSIEYSVSNICANNYQNQLMCIESIVCNISVDLFWDTVY